MAKRTLANRVMYDGLYTFVVRLLNIGCAAVLGILTARLLGPAGKGIYALPMIESGLVVTAFSGLTSALSYFLLNRKPGRRILVPAFATAGFYIAAGAIALVPIALLSGHPWTLAPALVFLPASAAVNLASGYFVGVKRVRYNSTTNVAITLLTLVLMACGLLLVARAPWVAIAAWLIANLVIGALAVAVVIWHSRSLQGDDVVTIPEFVRFGIKVGFVSLVSLLNYRADVYIVALLATPADLGRYTVAIAAAESLLVPTQVAALVTSPHIGSLDLAAANRLTAQCVRNNVIVAFIVCGVLFAAAQPLVHLLYGTAFLPVVPALRVLLVGVFALSLGSPMSTYFTLKLGRPEVPLKLAASSAAICIALALTLVPRLGITGAALASTVAYIGGQAGALWYFRRMTGTGVGAMLVPTRSDFALYAGFIGKVLQDGRRLLGIPTPSH